MKICLTISEVSLAILLVIFGLDFFVPEILMPSQLGLFLLTGLGSFALLKWLEFEEKNKRIMMHRPCIQWGCPREH